MSLGLELHAGDGALSTQEPMMLYGFKELVDRLDAVLAPHSGPRNAAERTSGARWNLRARRAAIRIHDAEPLANYRERIERRSSGGCDECDGICAPHRDGPDVGDRVSIAHS